MRMPLSLTFILFSVSMFCANSFSRYTLRPTLRLGAKVISRRRISSMEVKSAAATVPSVNPLVDASNARLLAMELPTNENSLSLLKTRHTSAHILAMAVQKTFPKVKVTVGPWIESGWDSSGHCHDHAFYIVLMCSHNVLCFPRIAQVFLWLLCTRGTNLARGLKTDQKGNGSNYQVGL